MGDMHPQGNPHVQLDPRNIAIVAKALAARLAQIDPAERRLLRDPRAGTSRLAGTQAIARWEAQAAPLKGVRSSSFTRTSRT